MKVLQYHKYVQALYLETLRQATLSKGNPGGTHHTLSFSSEPVSGIGVLEAAKLDKN